MVLAPAYAQLWHNPDIPKRDWHLMCVTDLGKGNFDNCEMCLTEIRYVHTMAHDEWDEDVDVGCICCGYMSNDYDMSLDLEGQLKNRSARRDTWLEREWRVSNRGNEFLNVNGTNFVVFERRPGSWAAKRGERFGTLVYRTSDEAKLALFDASWPPRLTPGPVLA